MDKPYLVIIGEITGLAHAHRIQKSILMGAVPGVLVSPVFTVAARAHILKLKVRKVPLRSACGRCGGT